MKKRKSINKLKKPANDRSVESSPKSNNDDDSVQHVKVAVRFRPSKEEETGRYQIEFNDETTFSIIENVANKRKNRSFTFDRVFDPETSQKEVFNVLVKDLLAEVVNGYNATVFAYGQTGCGKTYSMFGLEGKNRFVGKTRGIIPRSAETIFRLIDADSEIVGASIGVSLIEIYKEQFIDLLNPDNVNTLKLREDRRGDVVLLGCTEKFVSTPAQMIEIMASGEQNRTTAATEMNEVSSRSHTVCTVRLQLKMKDLSKKTSRLYLADLAGSERVNKSKLHKITLAEAKKINQSLATLGNCINALTDDKRSHVPFRDSKLTYFLKNALGGNCKTALLVATSPDESNSGETLSSLKFAQRSSHLSNSVRINKELSAKELQEQVKELQKALKQSKSVIRRLSSGMLVPKSSITDPLSPGREEKIDEPFLNDDDEPANKIEEKKVEKIKVVNKHRSRAGSRVGSRAGSRVGSRAGSRVASRAGSRVGSRAGSRRGSRAGSRKGSPKSKKKKSRLPRRASSRNSVSDLASKVFALARQDSMADRVVSDSVVDSEMSNNESNQQENEEKISNIKKKEEELKKKEEELKRKEEEAKNKEEQAKKKEEEAKKKEEEAKKKESVALHYARIVDGKCSNCDFIISQEWDFCASCGACVSEDANIRNEDQSIDVANDDANNNIIDVTTAPLQALKRIHVKRDSIVSESKEKEEKNDEVSQQEANKEVFRRPRSRRSSIEHLPDQPVAPAKIRSKSRDRRSGRRSGRNSPPVTARYVAEPPLTARKVSNNLKSPNADIEGVRTAPVSSDDSDSDDEMPGLVFRKPKPKTKTPRVKHEILNVSKSPPKRSSVLISEDSPKNMLKAPKSPPKRSSVLISEDTPKKKLKSPKRATISTDDPSIQPKNTFDDPWGTIQKDTETKMESKSLINAKMSSEMKKTEKEDENFNTVKEAAKLAAMAMIEAGAEDDKITNKNSKETKPWQKKKLKPKPKLNSQLDKSKKDKNKASDTLQQVRDESKTNTGPKPIKPSAIKKVYEDRATNVKASEQTVDNKTEIKNVEEAKEDNSTDATIDNSTKANDDSTTASDNLKEKVRRKSIGTMKRNSTLKKRDLRADKPWLRKRKKSSSQIDIVVLTPKKAPSRKNSLKDDEEKKENMVNMKDDGIKINGIEKMESNKSNDNKKKLDSNTSNDNVTEDKSKKKENKKLDHDDSLEDDLQNAMSYEDMKAKRKKDRKNRLSRTYGSSSKIKNVPLESNDDHSKKDEKNNDNILPTEPDSPRDKKKQLRRSSLQDDLENAMSYEDMRKQRKSQRKNRLSKAYSNSKIKSALKAQRSQGSLSALKLANEDLPPSNSHSSVENNLIRAGRRSDDMNPTPSTDNNDEEDELPKVIKFGVEDDSNAKKRPFWACCLPPKTKM